MKVEANDDVFAQVVLVLAQVLELDREPKELTRETELIGRLPGFDSQSVVALIMELEDEFGIEFDDDEVSASLFESIGSLCDFVQRKRQSDES